MLELDDVVDGVGVTLFKTVEALTGAFFFSTSVERKTKGAGGRRSWPWNDRLKHVFAFDVGPEHFLLFLRSVLTDRIWRALVFQEGFLYKAVVKRLVLPRL